MRLLGPLTGVVAAMARGAAGAQGSGRTGSIAAEMEGATGVATGCRARSRGHVGPGMGGTAMVPIATLGQLACNCRSCLVQQGRPSCRAPTAASLARATILPWMGRCTTPLLPSAWRVRVPRSRCFLCVVCVPPESLAAPGQRQFGAALSACQLQQDLPYHCLHGLRQHQYALQHSCTPHVNLFGAEMVMLHLVCSCWLLCAPRWSTTLEWRTCAGTPSCAAR